MSESSILRECKLSNMSSKTSCEIKCTFLGTFCWFYFKAFLSFGFTTVFYGGMTTPAASSLSDPIEWPDKTSVNTESSC